MELTQARLRELFSYDPKTGVFTRLKSPRTDRVGLVAGAVGAKGYVAISVDNRRHYAHRLAWLYVFGKWPSKQIDHRDTDKQNNRIANLRDVGGSENQQNRHTAKRNTASKLLGAYSSRGRWYSRIKVNDASVYLGAFRTAELAHAAYLAAKRIHHPTASI